MKALLARWRLRRHQKLVAECRDSARLFETAPLHELADGKILDRCCLARRRLERAVARTV